MMNTSLESEARYGRWLQYVNSVVANLAAAASLPTGPSPDPQGSPTPSVAGDIAAKIMICSPHPDDEALVGALPLRLHRESGATVVNCAITLGSNKAERPRRLRELQASCSVLGFSLVVPNQPHGLDNVTAHERENQSEAWLQKTRDLAAILGRVQPDLVLCPHREDVNRTHVGTHLLALDALQRYLKNYSQRRVILAETEYWRDMSSPNLLLGVTAETEATLVMAVAEHGGEVARNPYHIQHPARSIDNVRRGSEVVGGLGGHRCNFTFGELYRVSLLTSDHPLACSPTQQRLIIGPDERLTLPSLDQVTAHRR